MFPFKLAPIFTECILYVSYFPANANLLISLLNLLISHFRNTFKAKTEFNIEIVIFN